MIQDADFAALCKALSDTNRIRIVSILSERGEQCACKLLDELGITQPTLSHHMKVLCSCKLVDARKEGKWMHYTLSRASIAKIQSFIAAW